MWAKCFALAFLLSLVSCSPSVRFQGTALQGIGEPVLLSGGASIIVQLSGASFKQLSLDVVRNELQQNVRSRSNESAGWNSQVNSVFSTAVISFSNQRHTLRVTLGAASAYESTTAEIVSIRIPKSMIEDGAFEKDIEGPDFLVIPDGRISFHILDGWASVTRPVTLQFDKQNSAVLKNGVRIVDGTSCKDSGEAALAGTPRFDEESSTLTLVPLRGGILSVCYSPASTSPLPPELYARAHGEVLVSGPEGFSSDPLQPRAKVEFTVTIYGTNLTDFDSVVLKEQPCEESKEDNDMFDLTLISPSRGIAYVTVPSEGQYRVCYHHQSAAYFTQVAQIFVLKGGEYVIDTDIQQLLITMDSIVISPVHIGFLTIQSSTLSLEQHQLNVSHFVWEGGEIVGGGTINCMGSHSRIAFGHGPVVLQTSIKNFGSMVIELQHMLLTGRGTIQNFGDLTIRVNASEYSTLQGKSKYNNIVNAAGGKIRFMCLGQRCTLDIDAYIENHGDIAVSSQATVILRRGSSLSTASFSIEQESRLDLHSGRYEGRFRAKEADLRFVTGPLELWKTSVFSERSKIGFTGEEFLIDSVQVSGEAFLLFGGTGAEASQTSLTLLTVAGSCIFGADVTVAMGNLRVSSLFAGSAMIVEGMYLCHVPSVSFGENIIMQTKFHAVLFGGDNEETAKLIPQAMPTNSSLVVPSNATLLIMDIGNMTQEQLAEHAKGPRVCAYYVVVPIHVIIDGEVQMYGCAMLPFGGIHRGIVTTVTPAEIEATVQFALCRNLLVYRDNLCVPLFADSPKMSGIALGGEHFLSSDSSIVDLDVVEVTPDGSVESIDYLKMSARRNFVIHSGASWSFLQGGSVVSKILTVNGVLSLSQGSQLLIDGSVNVSDEGTLQMVLDSDTCSFPLSVTDALHFLPRSRFECAARLNFSSGETCAVAHAPRIIGLPRIEENTCANQQHRVVTVNGGDSIGLRLTDKQELPLRKTKIVSVAVVLLLALTVGRLLLWHHTSLSAAKELVKRPRYTLHLSWHEFSSFAANFVAIGSVIADAAMLCAPGFAPLVPYPSALSGVSKLSESLMAPHRMSGNTMSIGLVLSSIVIGLWGVSWIPLGGKRFSDHLKRLLHNQEQETQRHAIRLLFQFHTHVSRFFLISFIPVLSLLLEPLACSYIFESSPQCQVSSHFLIVSIPCFLLLFFLAPYSNSCRSFPFGHPPYMRELDVRFKNVFIFVLYVLYFVQVAVWKIFSGNVLQALFVSLLVQCSILAVHLLSYPCAYSNITRFCAAVRFFPIWSSITALAQVYRFGPGPQFVCSATDAPSLILLSSGFVIVALISWLLSRKRESSEIHMLTEDPSTAVHVRALRENHEKIEEYRLEMYNTASSRERERIAENIAAFRIQYLQLLNVYRRKKERFLLPFYLGEAVSDSLLSPRSPTEGEFDDAAFEDVLMKPMQDSAAVFEGDEQISVEQMENFIRGPPLGNGSYGVVSMGMLPNGKLTAVKEIKLSRRFKKEAIANAMREVNLLRSLIHPNIVRYYGCYTSGRHFRVFMEFAVGGSLTSLVRKFERLSEPVTRQYTYQILRGLTFLHSKNVVHRDIKGENILIDGQGVAKLADFGCSKALLDIKDEQHNSREGCESLVGSPYWMAPEVIRNGAYGTKADIWSVGCTVVEVLNGGNPPWHEKFDNVYSTMYYIGNTVGLPSNIPADVSDDCRAFLKLCFERDVTKRPSAADLLQHPWVQVDSEQECSPLGERQTTESRYDSEEEASMSAVSSMQHHDTDPLMRSEAQKRTEDFRE